MSDSTQDEAHTGPIKTPKQLLLAVFFSFLIPVLIIMGLVAYVSSDNKPAGSTEVQNYVLGGLTAQDLERGVGERIRKVGAVEIRDANRPLKSGEEVYKAQCTSCHTAGAAGAPKLGDEAGWGARIRQGFEVLVASALKGKGAMPAQAGGDFEDVEIARAVAYMANTAGGKFAEPQRPAAQAQADAPAAGAAAPATATAAPGTAAAAAPATAGATTAAAAPAATTANAAPAATAPAAAAPTAAAAPAATTTAAAAGAGEALYKQACLACHAAGVAGAPKLGDKAAWAPRLAQGVPGLTQSVIKGKGAMPPKGGSNAPDDQIRAAVEYMVSTVK